MIARWPKGSLPAVPDMHESISVVVQYLACMLWSRVLFVGSDMSEEVISMGLNMHDMQS